MNDGFLIIERYQKHAQVSCWALYLRSTTPHSLFVTGASWDWSRTTTTQNTLLKWNGSL